MISSRNNLQCVRLGQSYDWDKLEGNSLRIVKLASKQMVKVLKMPWLYYGTPVHELRDSYAWVMEQLELVLNFTGCITEHMCMCYGKPNKMVGNKFFYLFRLFLFLAGNQLYEL